jgi:hypothetical protein
MHEENGQVIYDGRELLQKCVFDLYRGGLSDDEIIQLLLEECLRTNNLQQSIKNDR